MNSTPPEPGAGFAAWLERYRLLAGVLLLALSFVAYQPALRGGFIWDDDIYLTGNRLIHAPDGLARFWTSADAMDYYPLSSSVLWLEWRLWGPQVAGYRLVNLLLHGLGGVLLWRILRRGMPALAWPLAALFVLHPINVEAVAWIAQLKTVLSVSLALASVLAWGRAGEGQGRGAYAASLLLFLASLLAKTTAVALPAVLLFGEWARQGRISRRAAWRTAPFFALALALGLVTTWFQQQHAITKFVVRPEHFASKVAGTGWAAWFYLGRFLFPHPLAICYPRWAIAESSLRAWLPLAALLVVVAALWLLRGRLGRWPLALALSTLALLAPVLGLLDIGFMLYSLVADHWLYVAFPALAALLALPLRSLVRRRPRALGLAGAALGVVLLLLSRRHAAVFAEELSLWEHNVKIYPSVWMGHFGFANALFSAGAPDAALPHYRRALELNPDHAAAHANLGALYALRDQAELAEAELRQAYALDPANPNTLFNLGRICLKRGRAEEARTHLEAALAYRPSDRGIRSLLAESLLAGPGGEAAARRARELARSALEDGAPPTLSGLDLLARAEAACGDRAAAARVARRAAALAGEGGLADEQRRLEALAQGWQAAP